MGAWCSKRAGPNEIGKTAEEENPKEAQGKEVDEMTANILANWESLTEKMQAAAAEKVEENRAKKEADEKRSRMHSMLLAEVAKRKADEYMKSLAKGKADEEEKAKRATILAKWESLTAKKAAKKAQDDAKKEWRPSLVAALAELGAIVAESA